MQLKIELDRDYVLEHEGRSQTLSAMSGYEIQRQMRACNNQLPHHIFTPD